jgi:hypothetical protein
MTVVRIPNFATFIGSRPLQQPQPTLNLKLNVLTCVSCVLAAQICVFVAPGHWTTQLNC